MKINFQRLRLRLLETTLAFENEKMLPQSSEAYVEPHSPVKAFDIVPVLRQLRAEGLIDGIKMENGNYLVTGITDDGREELTGTRERRDKLTGRLLTSLFRDEDEDEAKIYIERLKVGLLEMTWVYGKEQMLPKHAEAFLESRSLIPLWMVESALKELNAEGLIDGTEMRNKNYMVTGITVTGITDAGLETLKSSGRLFRLKRRYK